jgi:hypothetical protein
VTERDLVEGIQTAIKIEPVLRGAVAFKHAEVLTAGIPDLSVTAHGVTAWLEVKYLRRSKQLKDIIKELQIITCFQLAQHSGGRCWIAVYEERQPRWLTIWQPRCLAATLWPKMSIEPISTPGVHVWDGPKTFFGMEPWDAIRFYGAIRVEGHDHAMVAKLIRGSLVGTVEQAH